MKLKIDKFDYIKLLCGEKNHQQSQKTNDQLGENICNL